MKKTFFRIGFAPGCFSLFSALMAACLAITPALRANIVNGPVEAPELWAELYASVYASPQFSGTASGGPDGGGGSWVDETAQWSGPTFPPGHHIGVEVLSGANVFLIGKSQAGFNNGGVSLLRNHVRISGPPMVAGGEELTPSNYEASSWTTSYHQFSIEAPAGFWDAHDDYLFRHTFAVEGLISKFPNTSVSLSFSAYEGIDMPGSQSWYFDYGEEQGTMTDFLLSETFEAQWSPQFWAWSDTSALMGLGHSVSIHILSDNSGDAGFYGEANFFNTSAVSTITLLTQDGEEDPVPVVTFDNMGNVIEGDPNFSLSTPVPEPSTYALFFGLAAVVMTAARRFRRRNG